MSKRAADNYLTDRNWDDEVPAEEAGTFQMANDKEMQHRKIKKAVRRTNNNNSQSTTGSTPVFAGFGGFTALANTRPSDATTTSSAATVTSPSNAPVFNFGVGTQKAFSTSTKSVNGASATVPTATTRRRPNLEQLRKLNENVSAWINKHIAANPYCVLTPIFTDYDRYLASIEGRSTSTKQDVTPASSESPSQPTSTAIADDLKTSDNANSDQKTFGEIKKDTSTFSFVTNSEKTETISSKTMSDDKKPGALFSFKTGNTQVANDNKDVPKFSFATGSTASDGKKDSSTFSFVAGNTKTNDDKKGGAPFSFGSDSKSSGVPFSFASSTDSAKTDEKSSATFSFSAAKPSATESQTSEEEEYVPPKPDGASVQEEDAFYTKRCKLFVQKDGAWQEKGLGNLHLKPCNNKTQLLIRADTSLGNILLNIMLSEDLPMSRQGKNNVTLICVPNPPLDTSEPTKPASMLLKVKTAEDADELLARLNDAKTGC